LAPESRISAIPLKLLFLACFRARDPAASERLYLKALDHKFRNAAAAKNQCHRELPLAYEACLSGAEILTQLDRRLGRLRCVAELDAALRHFIEKGYVPAARRLVDEMTMRSPRTMATSFVSTNNRSIALPDLRGLAGDGRGHIGSSISLVEILRVL
jgi:hypothetical protein